MEGVLGRFLRANKGAVAGAVEQLAADVAWRHEKNVASWRKKTASAVLGCDVALVHAILPAVQVGNDREKHPIIFKHMGESCVIRKALAVTTLDRLIDYGCWLNEKYCVALGAARTPEWTVVIDAKGWHVGLFDAAAFQFLKTMAEHDATHYPERLAYMVVVNAPTMLALAWKNVIKRWVDDVTRQKIHIISDPRDARALLNRIADPRNLPAQYGGTASPLKDWPSKAGFNPSSM